MPTYCLTLRPSRRLGSPRAKCRAPFNHVHECEVSEATAWPLQHAGPHSRDMLRAYETGQPFKVLPHSPNLSNQRSGTPLVPHSGLQGAPCEPIHENHCHQVRSQSTLPLKCSEWGQQDLPVPASCMQSPVCSAVPGFGEPRHLPQGSPHSLLSKRGDKGADQQK